MGQYNELILGLKERKEKIELQQSEIDKRKKVRELGPKKVVQELKDRHNNKFPPNSFSIDTYARDRAANKLSKEIEYINQINPNTRLEKVHNDMEVIEELVLRSKENKKYLIEKGIVNENRTSGTSFPFTEKSKKFSEMFK